MRVFKTFAVSLRRVNGRHPLYGGVKVIKSLILNKKGNLSVDAAKRFVFFNQQDAIRFADRSQNGFRVKWPYGAQIDDLGGNLVRFLQCLGYLQGGVNGFPMRNDRKIRTFSNDIGFSEWNDEIVLFGNFTL